MAQYCYYNNNTSNPIHRINLNGNTYRKMNVNGTPYTISTWYSGTCKNAERDVRTISYTYDEYNRTVYRYTFTYSAGGQNTYSITNTYLQQQTWYASDGWKAAGYMSSSRTEGVGTQIVSITVTPSPGNAASPSYEKVKENYRTYQRVSSYYDVNFSYSASGIEGSIFTPMNYTMWYNSSKLPNWVSAYPTYTISCMCPYIYPTNRISTYTF